MDPEVEEIFVTKNWLSAINNAGVAKIALDNPLFPTFK